MWNPWTFLSGSEQYQTQTQTQRQSQQQRTAEIQTFIQQIHDTFNTVMLAVDTARNPIFDEEATNSVTDGAIISLNCMAVSCAELHKENNQDALDLGRKTVQDKWEKLKRQDARSYVDTLTYRDFMLAALNGEENLRYESHRKNNTKLSKQDPKRISQTYGRIIHQQQHFEEKIQTYLDPAYNQELAQRHQAELEQYRTKKKYKSHEYNNSMPYQRPADPSQHYFTESGRRAQFENPRATQEQKEMEDDLYGAVDAYHQIKQKMTYRIRNAVLKMKRSGAEEEYLPCLIIMPKRSKQRRSRILHKIQVRPAKPHDDHTLSVPPDSLILDVDFVKSVEAEHAKAFGAEKLGYPSINMLVKNPPDNNNDYDHDDTSDHELEQDEQKDETQIASNSTNSKGSRGYRARARTRRLRQHLDTTKDTEYGTRNTKHDDQLQQDQQNEAAAPNEEKETENELLDMVDAYEQIKNRMKAYHNALIQSSNGELWPCQVVMPDHCPSKQFKFHAEIEVKVPNHDGSGDVMFQLVAPDQLVFDVERVRLLEAQYGEEKLGYPSIKKQDELEQKDVDVASTKSRVKKARSKRKQKQQRQQEIKRKRDKTRAPKSDDPLYQIILHNNRSRHNYRICCPKRDEDDNTDKLWARCLDHVLSVQCPALRAAPECLPYAEMIDAEQSIYSIIQIGKQNKNAPLLMHLVDAYNRYRIQQRRLTIQQHPDEPFEQAFTDVISKDFILKKCTGFEALIGSTHSPATTCLFKKACLTAIPRYFERMVPKPPMPAPYQNNVNSSAVLIDDDIVSFSIYMLNAYALIDSYVSKQKRPIQIDLVIIPKNIHTYRRHDQYDDDNKENDTVRASPLILDIDDRLRGIDFTQKKSITWQNAEKVLRKAIKWSIEKNPNQRVICVIDRRRSEGEENEPADMLYCYQTNPERECHDFESDELLCLRESLVMNSKKCILPKIGNENEDVSVLRSDGDILTLSFHCFAADDIQVYLYYAGWGTRFFIEDIKHYLPAFFTHAEAKKFYTLFENKLRNEPQKQSTKSNNNKIKQYKKKCSRKSICLFSNTYTYTNTHTHVIIPDVTYIHRFVPLELWRRKESVYGFVWEMQGNMH